jgi:hypothetical protein
MNTEAGHVDTVDTTRKHVDSSRGDRHIPRICAWHDHIARTWVNLKKKRTHLANTRRACTRSTPCREMSGFPVRGNGQRQSRIAANLEGVGYGG